MLIQFANESGLLRLFREATDIIIHAHMLGKSNQSALSYNHTIINNIGTGT